MKAVGEGNLQHARWQEEFMPITHMKRSYFKGRRRQFVLYISTPSKNVPA